MKIDPYIRFNRKAIDIDTFKQQIGFKNIRKWDSLISCFDQVLHFWYDRNT
jgi:hypothetical protein